MINQNIKDLVNYAINSELITKQDEIYCTNAVLEILKLDEYEENEGGGEFELENILASIMNWSVEAGILADDITSRDLFDTKLMSVFVSKPSEVIAKFEELYAISPKAATEFYYKFSCDTDYIRRYRIKKDLKWKTDTKYGELDITVNLSKPEKDPKAIAAAKNAKQSGYPKCLLCVENEGYAGRMNHPARQNHRIIPLTIDGGQWGLQYSPYVYYNEHCIVFNTSHTPMKIDRSVFRKLFDFVEIFPHYFIGSNADLPIVGGSILTHEHFQGGNYEFAMAKAPIKKVCSFEGFENVEAGIVDWAMSVIRLNSSDKVELVELADKILTAWRAYSDEASFIFSETEGAPHNTITPIARMRDGNFELDLVLRNNITTDEHPMGVYHPHSELHNIKKENIGLIEVMGLAVLPSRLKEELKLVGEAIVSKADIFSDDKIKHHAAWVDTFISDYNWNEVDVDETVKQEVGKVFEIVLEHAGVYKNDEAGMNGFERFVKSVK